MYYDELCKTNSEIGKTYTFEQCKKHYARHWYSKRYLHDLGNLRNKDKRDLMLSEYHDFAIKNKITKSNMPGFVIWIC